jgi:hypothetical protein
MEFRFTEIDPRSHRRFYGEFLGFAEQPRSSGVAFRVGESVILLEENASATADPARQARGWCYITLQAADIDAVHDELRRASARALRR